jgi:predicted outer membrane repeat protein
MSFKNVMIILILLAFLTVSSGAVFADDNLTATCDDSDLLTVDEKSFADIGSQINDAQANDVISLEGDYKSSGSSISVQKPLTIDGKNKTTLDGDKKSGVFSIYSDNSSLKNLKIINSNGTAVYVFGNNLLIENCEFVNNEPSPYVMGGAISFSGNNLTVKNCRFTNNNGPLYVEGRNIAVTNSTFINNTGDAIKLYGLNEEITGCEFVNTKGSAVSYGGYSFYMHSIPQHDGSERFIVRNCTFTGNSADYGGAIYYTDFYDMSWFRDGLKINLNEGLIDNCTFTDNSARYSGGAIWYDVSNYEEGLYVSYSRMTISNSVFNNNKLAFKSDAFYNGGGAICMEADNNRIINCSFDSNGISSVSSNGGALCLSGDNCTVDRCKFRNSGGSVDEEYHLGIQGAAIFYSNGLGLTVLNSLFENSFASTGGAIYASLYRYSINKVGTLMVENSSFIKNTAYYDGAISASGTVKINRCEFIENKAEICSAVNAADGFVEITNSKFINNTSPWAMIISTRYSFNNNTYVVNSPEVFILGNMYSGKAYDVNLKKIELISIIAPSVKMVYNSNKYFTVKFVHKFTGKAIVDAWIYVRDAKTGKILGQGFTDSKGVFVLDKKFKVGTYKVKISLASNTFFGSNEFTFAHHYTPDPVLSSFEVTKISTSVKAPKVTAKHKKSKNFVVTVKADKKPVKKIKVKVKIGKKTYNVKTNSKGVVKINTKNLKVGKHKVVISSGDDNYKISAKSQITIKR